MGRCGVLEYLESEYVPRRPELAGPAADRNSIEIREASLIVHEDNISPKCAFELEAAATSIRLRLTF